jgi:hypothetical protein
MTATPSRTSTLSGTAGTRPTSAGGGYPNGTDIPTTELSGTPPTSTEEGGNNNYPGGGGTQSTGTSGTGVPGGGSETQGGEFVTQGTPVPFQTPTKGTESKPGVTSGVIAWILGILVGLSLIGGSVWYYFRKYKNDEKGRDNLFTDDPDN